MWTLGFQLKNKCNYRLLKKTSHNLFSGNYAQIKQIILIITEIQILLV